MPATSSTPDPQMPQPEARLPHRHLIFLDGTWNSDGKEGEQTHIVRLRNLALPVRREEKTRRPLSVQTIYYDEGVGTGMSGLDRFIGGALGAGLSTNVRQAYRYLSEYYRAGDEICVFGFSRGAYTARSLVGYIAAAGLLRRERCTEAAEAAAWAYYRTPPKKRSPGAGAERDGLVHTGLRIRAMGIFDTVGSLGIPSTWARSINRLFLQFHDTEVSSIVDYAFHALALDEKREPFQAAVWQRPRHEKFEKIEQVWFSGVHSDIGGGYADHRLGDIALHWMIDRLDAGPGTEAGPHVDFNEFARLSPAAAKANDAFAPEMKTFSTTLETKRSRELGPIEPDEQTRTEGLNDDPLAPQNESRTALYRLLYPWPLLRLVNQTWPRGDRDEIQRHHCINEFQPFQAPIAEMVHWSALVRLGRTVEIAEDPARKTQPLLYQPVNLVAVLPNILMTYTSEGDRLKGSAQDELDEMARLASVLRQDRIKDPTIRQVRVVRHVPDPAKSWRAYELKPELEADCIAVLAQLLRLAQAGFLKAP